jgi:branched-chain amino acid aminotransferase
MSDTARQRSDDHGLGSVWIDGSLLDPADAVVPYDDHGITVGDGAFETVKVASGRPFALRAHLDRLDSSLAALRLPAVDRPMLEGAAAEVCGSFGGDGFLRITVTAGRGPLGSPRGTGAGRVIVAIRPGTIRTEPTKVVTVPFTRNERGALAGVKSTSYAENVVALDLATRAGATEAIFANSVGSLCEGTGTNVFVVVDGQLVTPTLASGCLAGVTRALLLDLLPDAVEEDVPLEALAAAPEAFLVSTAREVQPISHVDGEPLAECPGPHTRRARAAWVERYG